MKANLTSFGLLGKPWSNTLELLLLLLANPHSTRGKVVPTWAK
jgi:hypothetical protein